MNAAQIDPSTSELTKLTASAIAFPEESPFRLNSEITAVLVAGSSTNWEVHLDTAGLPPGAIVRDTFTIKTDQNAAFGDLDSPNAESFSYEMIGNVEGGPVAVDENMAFSIPTSSPGNQAFPGSLGMDFDADAAISVTQLGAFDDLSDGMNRAISVAIFDRTTGEVVGQTVTITSDDPLEGGHRFEVLDTPLSLPAGFEGSVVAWGYGEGERNANYFDDSGLADPMTDTGDGLIRLVGSGRFSMSAGVFPEAADVGGTKASQYGAGTFAFSAAAGCTVGDLPGDFDQNGSVDFSDFLVLSANFGKEVTAFEDGDTDCDGTVDFQDFLKLSSNFGMTIEVIDEPGRIESSAAAFGAVLQRGFPQSPKQFDHSKSAADNTDFIEGNSVRLWSTPVAATNHQPFDRAAVEAVFSAADDEHENEMDLEDGAELSGFAVGQPSWASIYFIGGPPEGAGWILMTTAKPMGFRALFGGIGVLVPIVCFFSEMHFLIDAKNDEVGLLLTFALMFFFGGIGFLLGWPLDRALPGPQFVHWQPLRAIQFMVVNSGR